MSPGLQALPSGRFSTAGTRPITLRGETELGNGADRTEDTRRAAHVELHLVHGGTGLDGDPARVERHALSDEGDRRFALVPPRVFDDDELRGLPAAARDRDQGSHAEIAHSFLFEDLDGHRLVLLREGGRVLGDMGGSADVAGSVPEIAGETLPRDDCGRFGEGAPRRRAIGGRADHDPSQTFPRGSVLPGLAFVEPVHGIAVGLGDAAQPPRLMPAGDLGLAEEVHHAARPCAGHRPHGRPHGPSEAAVVEAGTRAEAHQQHPPCGDASRAVQEHGRTGRRGEISVRNELSERTTGRFVDLLRGGSEPAPLVYAEHEAVGPARERIDASRGEVDH